MKTFKLQIPKYKSQTNYNIKYTITNDAKDIDMYFKAVFISLCCGVFIFSCVVFSYGREKYSYNVSGKRNPFMPLITADGRFINLDIVKTPKLLSVQGVMYEPNGISYAIVNAVIVKEGDIVEGSQVIKIEENKVSFIKDGQISEVEFKKGGENEE